jgi:hypothetical protein
MGLRTRRIGQGDRHRSLSGSLPLFCPDLQRMVSASLVARVRREARLFPRLPGTAATPPTRRPRPWPPQNPQVLGLFPMDR